MKLSMTIKMLDCLHLECLVSHGKQLTAQLLPDHHAVNTEHTPIRTAILVCLLKPERKKKRMPFEF